jgi:branched-chain amino acid aminotransferase
VSIRRISRVRIDLKAKTLNYVNKILAKIEALEAGFDEAVMLNKGYVSEASTENIFAVKIRKSGHTSPLSAGVLDGITRKVVITIARSIGFEVAEENMSVHDLYNADGVFVTGTAAEVVPVTQVDGVPIGQGEVGPVSSEIRSGFLKVVYDSGESQLFGKRSSCCSRRNGRS